MAGSAAAGAGHPDRAEVAMAQLDPRTPAVVTIQTSVAEAGQGNLSPYSR